MPLQYRKTLVVSAASTNGIAASQTPVGAIDLTLASSVVTLPNTGQRPQIITTSDLSNRSFTFYGTDITGRLKTYSIVGPNNATLVVPSTFYTITRVAISGTAAGALTVGWAAQADLQPLPLDTRLSPTDIGFACIIVSGSPTYTVRFTMDDVQDATLDPGAYVWFDHPIVSGQTANNTGNFGKPVVAASLYMTGAGTMRYVSLQGVAGG